MSDWPSVVVCLLLAGVSVALIAAGIVQWRREAPPEELP